MYKILSLSDRIGLQCTLLYYFTHVQYFVCAADHSLDVLHGGCRTATVPSVICVPVYCSKNDGDYFSSVYIIPLERFACFLSRLSPQVPGLDIWSLYFCMYLRIRITYTQVARLWSCSIKWPGDYQAGRPRYMRSCGSARCRKRKRGATKEYRERFPGIEPESTRFYRSNYSEESEALSVVLDCAVLITELSRRSTELYARKIVH